MERGGFVYIMTNKNNSVLYTGATSDLQLRIYQHKTKAFPNSFSARYNADKLIYIQGFQFIAEAIEREKQIKSWSRKRKEVLINSLNPDWIDLYDSLKKWD